MAARPDALDARCRAGSGIALFVARWLANPLQMGSVMPSSPALCCRVARQVRRGPDEWVLELGAGTGVVSRALLDGGLPPERVTVLEIVPDMADHLRAMVLLPLVEQSRFIDATAAVAPGRGFPHYSYCVTSPLPHRKHGLAARREAWTPLNVPPASVWRYTPAAAA